MLGVEEDWPEIPPLRTQPRTLGPISARCRRCQNTWLVLQEHKKRQEEKLIGSPEA